MTLIGNKLGSYEDSQDEKSRAEKVLDKAKKMFAKKKLKQFRLDSKTVVFMPSKKAFEEFKKSYKQNNVIWE